GEAARAPQPRRQRQDDDEGEEEPAPGDLERMVGLREELRGRVEDAEGPGPGEEEADARRQRGLLSAGRGWGCSGHLLATHPVGGG
ncbi:MAG: hypothetical protein ACK55I_08300, partial [bacterium]